MSRVHLVIAAVVIFLVMAVVARADNADDSRRSAQYLLGFPKYHASGSYSYNQYDDAGEYVGSSFVDFRQEGDGDIVKFVVNGVVRVDTKKGDRPLKGLPGIRSEARNFSLFVSLWADEKEVQQIAYGNLFEQVLNQEVGIVVPLTYNRINWFFPFGSRSDLMAQNLPIKIDGLEFGYNQFFGGFFVVVDPIRETPYEIIAADGSVTNGVIDPLRPKNKNNDPGNIGLSVRLPGDVTPVTFNQSGQAQLIGQEFGNSFTELAVGNCPSGDCQPRNVAARSYTIEVGIVNCLFVEISSQDNLTMVFERWVASGDMRVLATTTSPDLFASVEVCGEDKIVLTIYQDLASPPSGSNIRGQKDRKDPALFGLYLDISPNQGGGGSGGKG